MTKKLEKKLMSEDRKNYLKKRSFEKLRYSQHKFL